MGNAAQQIAAHLLFFHGKLDSLLLHGQLLRQLLILPRHLHLIPEPYRQVGGYERRHQKKDEQNHIILIGYGKRTHRFRKQVIEYHNADNGSDYAILVPIRTIGHQKHPHNKKHQYIFLTDAQPVKQKRKQRGNEHNPRQPSRIPDLI